MHTYKSYLILKETVMVSTPFCFQLTSYWLFSLFLAPSKISIDSIFQVNTIDVNVILMLMTELLDVCVNVRWTQTQKT